MGDFFPIVFISILFTLFYSEHILISLEIREKGENSRKSKAKAGIM